jgi:hypothetical protein
MVLNFITWKKYFSAKKCIQCSMGAEAQVLGNNLPRLALIAGFPTLYTE